MSVAGEVTYLRRFAGKFVEIVAAGIGTAVSGYLVAFMAGHFAFFSWFTPAAVSPAPPKQAISSPAAPHDTASIEATVRAALASHDVSEAAPIVAPPQPPTLASAEIPASAATAAPPLAAAEIRSLPVAAAEPLPPAEPDGWPPEPTSGASRLPSVGRMLPPQPPPANGNLFNALKHFF